MHKNIKSFLATVSLQSEFSVNMGNMPPLENVNCAVRFVFMEIGSPNVRGVIYLPETMPSTDLKTGCKLIYIPMNPGMPEISFSTSKPGIIDTWLQFSGAVPVLRDKLLMDSVNEDLAYREDFEDGHFLELTRTYQLIFDFTTVQINKNSRLKISEIGKPPAIGVYDRWQPDSVKWINMPNFRSLCVWYLLLICAIQKAADEEEKGEDLAIEVADIEVAEAPEMTRKIETSIKKPRYQAGAVFIEHPRVTRKLSVDQESMKKCEEEIIQLSISLADRLDTLDTSSFAKPALEPEPQLSTPVLPTKEEVQYLVNETPQPVRMDMEQLKREAYEQLSDFGRVNWEHFNPDYQSMELSVPVMEYNSKSGLSFEETFERALPIQAYILTAALLVNGSERMNSLSKVFGIEMKRQTKVAEAFAIIDAFGARIFEKIVEMRSKIEQTYLPCAIVRDISLMKRFSLMHKRFEKPRNFSESLPFQFSIRPLKSFDHWFADCMHKFRIGTGDTQNMVIGWAYRLHELFTSYLTPGKQLNEFMREITVESGIVLGPWMVFMTFSDFMTTWIEFWTKSFKEEKLMLHFIEALKHSNLISKYYLPCAPIRNIEVIEKVAKLLKFFESLGLAADFVVKPSEAKSLASFVARTAEFVGFGKK